MSAGLTGARLGAAVPPADLRQEFAHNEVRAFLARAEEAAEPFAPAVPDYAQAADRLRLVLDTYAAAPAVQATTNVANAHARSSLRETLIYDFFSWRRFFRTVYLLDAAGQLDPALRSGARTLAQAVIQPRERGPNNRAYHFALGAIYAAKLFPEDPAAAGWRAYAEAVWQDWWTLGDGYEPGYVAHHFPEIIELGEALGHGAELRSERARLTFYRFRDHISATGRAIQPGDPGGPGDQSDYLEGLAVAARATGDRTMLAAAQRALDATPGASDRMRRLIVLVAAEIKESAPPLPALALIQPRYPATLREPDRALLSLPSAPAQPFAAFTLHDRGETLFHAHEDQRGALYHYEAGGARLLGHATWAKSPAGANTFIVTAASAEFPLAVTRNLATRTWLLASADLRALRYFQEGEGWIRRDDSPAEQYQTALVQPTNQPGYLWANPASFTGAHDMLDLATVTLRFLALPSGEVQAAVAKKDHYLNTLSFTPGFFWYREYRPLVALDGPLEMLVMAPTLGAGAPLADFRALPDDLELTFFAPDTHRGPGRVVPRPEWSQFLRVEQTARGPAWHVSCPPGRLDVTLHVRPRRVALMEGGARLEFAYQILPATRGTLFRLPLAVAINGLRPRSIYLDAQQGGRLLASTAALQGGDAGAAFTYGDVFANGAEWTRRAVLTREGALIVLDEYSAVPEQGPVGGGPIWQLAAEPKCNGHEFIARSFDRPDRRVRVWLHAAAGDEPNVQRMDKLSGEITYAVSARRVLAPGQKERFLSVLAPEELGRSVTTLLPSGAATAEIAGATVRFAPDGTWSIVR